jgi:cytochrome b561
MPSQTKTTQFAVLLRILHWLMAASLVVMLFIGVSMVSSLSAYHKLLVLHRPMGMLIFVLAGIRVFTRIFTLAPRFPATMSPAEVLVAKASERLLYMLFFALPLVGWGMLSAGHYPIVIFGAVHLPPILPAKAELYSPLREAHTVLAYLLFFAVLSHIGAVLFHAMVLRDGLLGRMLPWSSRADGTESDPK